MVVRNSGLADVAQEVFVAVRVLRSTGDLLGSGRAEVNPDQVLRVGAGECDFAAAERSDDTAGQREAVPRAGHVVEEVHRDGEVDRLGVRHGQVGAALPEVVDFAGATSGAGTSFFVVV